MNKITRSTKNGHICLLDKAAGFARHKNNSKKQLQPD